MSYDLNKIIDGIPNETYHRHSALSSTNLKDLLKSPWSYWHNKQNPKVSTPAMQFGSLVHKLILEPENFANEYMVAGKPERRSKAGKAKYAELLEEAGSRIWVSTDDFLKAQDLIFPASQNLIVKNLLSGGKAESSVFWQDEATGVQCKAKADYLNIERGYILDVKTTVSLASERAFLWTVSKYAYDLSASFYKQGFELATGKELDFYFLVIEKEAPFNFATYKIGNELLRRGEAQYKQALNVYVDALERGKFDIPYHNGNLIELIAA
jgi:hypothetical protein